MKTPGGGNKFDLHLLLAEAYLQTGAMDEAAAHYQEALRLKPESEAPYLALGAIALRRGDAEGARACFARALELNARNEKALCGLAMALSQLGEQSETFERCLAALGISAQNLASLFRKVILLPERCCLIQVDGMPMYIHKDTFEFENYVKGWEPYTTELWKQSVKEGALVLDIGAQYGYFSQLAAKRVGPKGRVYAFEPEPENFELLSLNVEMNRLANIQPVQKAVADRSASAKLILYQEGSGLHSIYRRPDSQGVTTREEISVECIALDEFLEGSSVDLIKLDIEGGEPAALEGMRETIARSPNLTMFAEFAPILLRQAGVEPWDYLDQIRDLGFEVHFIDDHGFCLRPITKGFVRSEDPWWCANLYCLKQDRGAG